MSAPNKPEQVVRPIVKTGIQTEFGELQDDPATLMDEAGMNGDYTHVPGFSDMRKARDTVIAENSRDGTKRAVPSLPVNLHWFRRTSRDGTPNNTRTVAAKNAGYRPVRVDEIGKVDWISAMPAGAFRLPDGTIGSADGQLQVLDGRSAAKRAHAKTVRMIEQNVGSHDAALQQAAKSVPGSTPEVTTETLSPQQG